MNLLDQPAHRLAGRVRGGELTAEALASAALERIGKHDGSLNCFTTVLGERALADARAVDARVRRGQDPGPLCGVPFGVKDLYDVEGVVTRAGSRILADNPPAAADAVLVRRLRAAGAVLIGCQNMDEFAYGFTTENAHYGATHNPHDLRRSAGGSSGGSAAAVAAGLVCLSLGSDTNGSIRVPASYCGVFGLKPTFGRLPRTGTFPFVHALDHLGPFARNAIDLALAYDVLQGYDRGDPACTERTVQPVMETLAQPLEALRVAILDDWFELGASETALQAVRSVAQACGPIVSVTLPEARRARAAAFCLTGASAASLHRERLRSRPEDFDPATRDRLFAAALLPATVLARAERLRRWFAQQAARLFERFDLLLAAATPDVAPLLGQSSMSFGAQQLPVRANIGVYTQPISFIGLPVVAVPTWGTRSLPIGVQLIAPPWQEGRALRVAAALERHGTVSASPANAAGP